jgi:hypothetical protein
MRQADSAEIRGLAAHLAEAATEAAQVSRLISQSWWDERGREIADAVTRIGHDLELHAERAAGIAAGFLDALTTQADPAPGWSPGVRLPGIGGRRETEERGVRLPLLGDADVRDPAP